MWRTIRRETGLIEHVCRHGTGHPNAGSVQYMDWYWNIYQSKMREWVLLEEPKPVFEEWLEISEPASNSSWWVHGCDGCCGNDDYPGWSANAIKHAFDQLSNKQKRKIRKKYFMLWWGIMAACEEAVPE